MTTQRLEKDFRETLKNHTIANFWWLKLQANPMSYTSTPADYIILGQNTNYLVECKETRNDRFEFSRLTQLAALLTFSNYPRNKAYTLIRFWNTNKNNSTTFLIDTAVLNGYIITTPKKSMNLTDAMGAFSNCVITLQQLQAHPW